MPAAEPVLEPRPAAGCRVRVLLFSVLRERVGRREVQLDLPSPATGADLLDNLATRFPAIAAYRPVVRLAVNEVYASESVVLRAGDEVALITPVSGG